MSNRLVIQTGTLVGVFALIYILFLALPPIPALREIDSFLPLHTIMETFSVVVSCMIFGIIWNTCDASRSRNIILLGAAFLGVGLLDFAHLMSYKGMPDFVTASSPQKGIVFWMAARLVAALAMFVAAAVSWRPLSVTIDRGRLLAVFLGLTALVYWAGLWHPEWVPIFWEEGQGLTTAKLTLEYLAIAMYAASAILFYRLARNGGDFDCRGMFLASSVMVISELCFTSYSTVTDAFNLLGHIYKVVAYLFLYQALFLQLVRDPYRKLDRSRHEIWLEKERAEVSLHSIMDGVITTDAAGNVVSMNPVARQLTGWSDQAAQGLPLSRVFSVFDETDNSPIENPVEKCLRERRAVLLSNHAMIVSAFGTAHAIEQLASPIIDRNSEIIGVVLVFRDVTEHRKARDELRRKERGLSEAQAIAHLGSWEWDIETGKQSWSDECFRIFGFLPGEIEAGYYSFMNIVLPDDREAVVNSIHAALNGPSAYYSEFKIRRPNGEVRHILSQGEVVPDRTGKPAHMTGINLDITDRKQAEHELKQSEAEHRRQAEIQSAILDALPAKLALIDGNGYIIAVNRRWRDFSGDNGLLEEQAGVGANYFAMCGGTTGRDKGDSLDIVAGLRQVLDGIKNQYLREYPLHSPDGQRWYRMLAVPLSASEHLGAVVMHLDITESRQQKNEIEALNQALERRVAERTSQLEAANKELEAFSYSVSHDLRAPLRVIDGFAQILAADYAPSMAEAARRHLDRIQHATARMGELIDDLLQLSRVGREDLNVKTVNLSQVAEDILRELKQREPDRRTRLGIAPDQSVRGDVQLLRIVLENLLGNAWKFTRNREVTEIEFGALHDGKATVYFVRDNGVGFNQKYAYKLFGAFQRLHSEDEFEGTGIGLATVQRIISRHGGSVWAESKPGEGAVFFFRI